MHLIKHLIINEYDYTSGFAAISSPEGWEKGALPTGTQTTRSGKVTAIINATAKKEGNTLYFLQGRDENGMRTYCASNKTIRYGSSEEKLFAGLANYTRLESMISGQLIVEEAINRNAGLFLSDYPGYHSR